MTLNGGGDIEIPRERWYYEGEFTDNELQGDGIVIHTICKVNDFTGGGWRVKTYTMNITTWTYEGEFTDGQRNGNGVMYKELESIDYNLSGSERSRTFTEKYLWGEGEWKDGQLYNGTVFRTNGKKSYEVVDGKKVTRFIDNVIGTAVLILIPVVLIATYFLWNVFVEHRPFRNKKFYALESFELDGEVVKERAFASRGDYIVIFKTLDGNRTKMYIPLPFKVGEWVELLLLMEGQKGILHCRKDDKYVYYDRFVKHKKMKK
jgi:hypothetical protein